jgi:mannose-1-phosphate guanylyltransferase
VLLHSLRQFVPKTAALIDGLPPFTSRRFAARMREAFPQCENISIDYAVLERASNVVGFAAGDIGWNDVGSWDAVYELQPRDAHGNALSGDTRHSLVEDSTGVYVDAKGKLVALLGVKDLIVVDTPDALLIADRRRAQEVGNLVKRLEQSGREDLL